MRKQSDSEALEQLYDLYEQKMYAVAFSILHNEWQAEDAVQDAFVRLFKNIKRLKNLEAEKTRAYVLRTIQNTAIDLYRKNHISLQRTVSIEEREIADECDDMMNLVSRFAGENILEEMLSRLPDSYREVLMLRCVHQLSSKETAAVLEISEALVRKRQQRAINKLRMMMGDDIYVRQRI